MSINIDSNYQASKYEDKIYKLWEDCGCFTPKIEKDKEPFVISMPPPNATGVLHLGHAVMLALEDIMIRYNRMQGTPSLWLPGTDHASIATQNKVEQILSKEGKNKYDLGRREFLKEVDKYVKNSQDIIRNQIRKMGASCDWTRERFTLDKGLTNAVQEVFIRMYKDGLIYRGDRIVNWCPRCESTLADDEVEYKELTEKLYWLKYGPFTLATTRPETKLGDTAVAVHPDDKRYKDMIGKKFMIPGVLGDFEIKVVGDTAVDPEFGSGAVKVTPSHSFTDYEIAKRHNLPFKSIINEKGQMMENCGKYAEMTTKECRKAILDDMDKMGLIENIEDYTHNLSICYRCGHTIEPLISAQWFIDVNKKAIKDGRKKLSIKEKAISVIREGDIKIIPKKFNKIYFHWMENLHDWCISRQIWYGHRIPVWHCKDCNEFVASKTKPNKKCKKCKGSKWKQDPDTLDTWFSSGLWTFSTLGWPEKTEDYKYFHPTSVMETGYDILFFWVARMIIMSTYILNEIPFKTVYLHGLVRDKNGQKMSKSKPETCIDPLEMIEKYGTDAVRLSLVIGSSPGNDIRLYEEKIAGYRNFVTKIWNASRFALMNIDEESLDKEFEPGMVKSIADKWILTRLQELIKKVNKDLKNYRFSDAGTSIYEFIWGMYCDWYLEISKGEHKNPAVLKYVLENVLKLLHPFTPFVTEKLWSFMKKDKLIINSTYPKVDKNLIFEDEANILEIIKEVIGRIRSIRAELKVEPSKLIHAIIYADKYVDGLESKRETIMRLARLESLELKEKGPKIKNAKVELVDKIEIYLPLKDMIDYKKEKNRLEKEYKQKSDYIQNLKKKLNNKGFIDNAPKDLIESEKAKLECENEKLNKLKFQLKELEKL
ncbi:valine--tRNA ligase [Candidatus Peregrinibacteria bacterium]|nr:valine--tRNA ligase [Candidatus Peregrinibacteria bacterium]